MGNAISEAGIIKKTDLGNFITNWALNDYTPDKTNPSQASLKYSLKKRACCTNQDKMPIALPDTDNLKPGKMILTSILIPIFADPKDITTAACTMKMTADTDGSYKYTESTGGIVISTSSACENIYSALCPILKRDRAAVGDTEIQQLYSINSDTASGGKPSIVNPFVDCNCENSWYRMQTPLTLQNADPVMLSHNLDTRCAGSFSKTYKPTNKGGKTLCFNSVSVGGNMTAQEQADLRINQSCSASSTNVFGSSEEPKTTSSVNKTSNLGNEPLISKITGPTLTPAPPTSPPPTSPPPTSPPPTSPPPTSPPPTTTPPTTTSAPTDAPTDAPTSAPTSAPTAAPTSAPTSTPTPKPLNYVLIGGIAVGVLVVLAVIAFFVMSGSKKSSKSSRRDRDDDE
jgi:hypothetical protein